ncbi:MAG: glycine cleavage system protein GcvH [Bacillota bacterium]|nr:glycine cleavage system protein GcvH [Bacillota bacterium]
MELKKDALYAKSHEWVVIDGDNATIGISDFAQSELGDLVFVNLPEVGDEVVAGEIFADVESVKAVSDIFSPVSGTVAEINEELQDAPEMINENANEAWFIKVEGVKEKADGLLSPEEYEVFCEEEA